MKKYVKWLLGAAAIGSSIGLIIAHFCKNSKRHNSEETAAMEEEDFDLDSDLKPSSERGYVSLNKTQENPEEKTADSSEAETETTEEAQQTETADSSDAEKAETKAPEADETKDSSETVGAETDTVTPSSADEENVSE